MFWSRRLVILIFCGTVGGLMAPARSAENDIPLHGTSRARFATVAEGQALIARPDDFTKALSRFDIESRLKQTGEQATVQRLLEFAAGEVRPWTDPERERVAAAIAELRGRLMRYALPLPETVLLIKTTGRDEGGAAYTRQNAIVLPQRRVDGAPGNLQRLLAHELFHVLSRNDANLRDQLYAIVGFRRTAPIQLPAAWRDRRLTNPDAPLSEHYLTIRHDGADIPAAPILYARIPRYDPEKGGSFFRYLEFRLLALTGQPGKLEPLLVDGEPVLIQPRSNESYFRQIGRNTAYIIHPEEVLADNFVYLVLGKADLKSPEIVKKLGEGLPQVPAP